MREVGAAALPIIPTFDGLKANLEKGLSGPLARGGADGGRRFGDNAGRSLTASFSKHAKKAALLATGALAGAGYAAFRYGSDAVNLAAELEQSVGAIDVVFKKSSDQMHDWAKSAATDVGLTRNEFNELGSLIGTQLKNGGTAMQRLAPKTRKLITLGSDLSAMFGGETREAVEALSSALKGERDPIERYGVTLNEAGIKAEALTTGIAKAKVDSSALRQASIKLTVAQAKYNEEIRKHGKDSLEATKAEGQLLAATDKFNKVSAGKVEELSAQQKQAATLSLIYKQTADAQGTFGRESDTLSHKQQVLKARLEDTKTEIGTALLPIVSDAADFLLEEGVPAFQKFADWFGAKGVPALQDFGKEMKPIADEVLPAVGHAIEDIGGFLKTAAPYAKDLVGYFNDMPDWAKTLLVAGGVGLGVKSKLSKSGFLGGDAGGSLTDPAFVYVVNAGANPVDKKSPLLSPKNIAAGVLGYLTFDATKSSTDSLFNSLDTSAVDKLKESLETDLGKYADDLGINIGKLAEDLYQFGSQGEYVKQVLGQLQDASTADNIFEGMLNDLSPFHNKISDLEQAIRHLKDSFQDLDRGARNRHNLANLDALAANDKPGNPFAAMYGGDLAKAQALGKIPESKLKLLQDPETVRTREDVRELLGDVDGLTRKDFKVIFNALGLTKAKNDARDLLGYLKDLSGATVPSPSLGGSSSLNPFAGRPGPADRLRSGSGLRINSVNITGATSGQVVDELLNLNRRAAIGGY